MSALGHKQTCAAHNLMSALPPIATAKADILKSSCLLYPRKRTCAAHYVMSALGQKRTVFAYVFSACFCARYICADARSNWNQGAPLPLCSRVRPFDLLIRQTDDKIEHRE